MHRTLRGFSQRLKLSAQPSVQTQLRPLILPKSSLFTFLFPLATPALAPLRISRQISTTSSLMENASKETRETLGDATMTYSYVVDAATLSTLSRPKLDGKFKYECPWDTWKMHGGSDMLGLYLKGDNPPILQRERDPSFDKEFPAYDTDMGLITNPKPAEVVSTWIGHSTFLVQYDGINFLTDPIWSDRCSPISFAGPKRFRKPPFELEKLPKIDFVVISHSHYDHLDTTTIAGLPKDVLWIVPLGLKAWFDKEGVTNCVELDWWQEVKVKSKSSEFKVACTPTQHWSNRSLWDVNETLWGSFVVEGTSGRKIYFGGDTGYCAAFKEIGATFGGLGTIDLGLIPIGAYFPEYFMKYSHCNPSEAVQIHLDIKSRKSVGCHWGTFALTAEPVLEPRELLAKAIKEKGLNADDFITLNIGESLVIHGDRKSSRRGTVRA